MPYIQRDDEGKIVAVFDRPNQHATEQVPASHPGIVEFLFGDNEIDPAMLEGGYFQDLYELRLSDLAFVRVLEDVIYLLLDKKILTITDFPAQAIRRMKQREKIRGKLRDMGNVLFSSDEPEQS